MIANNEAVIHSWNELDCYKLSPFIRKIGILFISFIFLANFSCGKEERIGPKSKTNSPPVISAVSILPEKPTQESELNVFIQSHDPDGDPVTLQCQWIRNDEEISGENQNSFKSGIFKKGDLIRVKATPFDGKENGAPFLSDTLKILNSLPVIQEVWIEPKAAYATDRLKANARSSDPDGDAIYYTYQWEKNGAVLNEEKGEVLEQGRFKKGDSIALTIIPDDRENLGRPKRSNHVIISNSPPIIVSLPPASVEKETYLYQVKANDPDNDPIFYALIKGPKGMNIDKNTGLIRWEIRKEDIGNHSVEIEVSDDERAKSVQRYTLKIDFR